MIALRVEAACCSFRKPYCRGVHETYKLAPYSTVFGMLLSLIGEYDKDKYKKVRMGTAYLIIPSISTNLSKRSRWKDGKDYWVDKDGWQTYKPVSVQQCWDIDFVVFIEHQDLESKVSLALRKPQEINRSGALCLGGSDDIVDSVTFYSGNDDLFLLTPSHRGDIELPVYSRFGGKENILSDNKWNRFNLSKKPIKYQNINFSEIFVDVN